MKRWRKKLFSIMTVLVMILCTAIPTAANDGGSEYAEALRTDDGKAVLTVYDQEGVDGEKILSKEYSLTELDNIAEHDASFGYEYMKTSQWAVWATSVCAPLETILSDCGISFNDGDQIIISAGTDGFSYTLNYEVYQNSCNFYPSVTAEDLTNMENGITVPCVIGICWDGAGTVEGDHNAAAVRDELLESSFYSGSLRLFLGSKADDFYNAGSSGGRESSSTVAGNRSVNGVDSITVMHNAHYDYEIDYMSREEKPYQKFYLKKGATIPVPDTHPSAQENLENGEDYDFDYWYSRGEDGKEIKYEPNIVATENVIYYPKWKKKDGSGSGEPGGSDEPGPSTEYEVTITAPDRGRISADVEKAAEGDIVRLTVSAEKGYRISSVSVHKNDGGEIDVNSEENGKYSFVMPSGAVTVEAAFSEQPTTDIYEVKLPSNVTGGKVSADKTRAEAGEKVTLTVTSEEGYTMETLSVKDDAGKGVETLKDQGNGTFSFIMPAGLAEVNVSFQKTESLPPEDDDQNCPSKEFSDLNTELWYHAAVDFVLKNRYFNGTSDTTFEPEGTMTRAMFVTVLSRMEGINASQYTGSDFNDVETGQWYSAAIKWASGNGIVTGIGDEKFDPNGNVSREQMAAIMYRYANFKSIDTSNTDASKFSEFTDNSKVSDWAVDAVKWAADKGIINGMGDNTIEPQGTATRAQVAQIVKNYQEKVNG